jgi:hypothetical protein
MKMSLWKIHADLLAEVKRPGAGELDDALIPFVDALAVRQGSEVTSWQRGRTRQAR